MNLLEDIQTAAVDPSNDLSTLLRKCKLLTIHLKSRPLENWLRYESTGYPEDVQAPDYRVWRLEFKGNFSGPLRSSIENAPIPTTCIPEKTLKAFEQYMCQDSIFSLEEAIKSNSSDTFRVSTGNLALYLGMKVYKHHCCLDAWGEYKKEHVHQLLNSVRHRILDFALAVWKEKPSAGNPDASTASMLSPMRVTQIFHTIVYRREANSLDSQSKKKTAYDFTENDCSSLKSILWENGVSHEDIEDLGHALESDDKPDSAERFGPHVSAWIAKMMQKAADGSWNIRIGKAGNLLDQTLARFYGF